MTNTLTRRSMLGHSAVALIGGAGLALAVPDMDARAAAVHDPMLDLIERYKAQREAYSNSDPDMEEEEAAALAKATFIPLSLELCDNPPAITTAAGAYAALTLAAETMEHSEDGFTMPLVHAVIDYLAGLPS